MHADTTLTMQVVGMQCNSNTYGATDTGTVNDKIHYFEALNDILTHLKCFLRSVLPSPCLPSQNHHTGHPWHERPYPKDVAEVPISNDL